MHEFRVFINKSFLNYIFVNLQTNSPGDIRIEVGVVEQYLMESMKNLKGRFPNWVDVIAFSSFLSTYTF